MIILLSLVSLAQTGTPPAQPGIGGMLIPFICIGVIFYFLILRPQKQQQKKLVEMVSALKTGDKVVTTGGIHGIIANVKDGTTLLLKVDDGCRIEVDKAAIATIKKE
jgi:preprotein translocase subunit YajC